MAFIPPSDNSYDPSNDIQHTGEFVAKCVAVKQGLTIKSQPTWKPRIAIEFKVWCPSDPQLHAKKVAILCGESLWRNPQTDEPSAFIRHAESMGVEHPENGFDPQRFVNQWFMIEVYFDNGRFFVRTAIPVDKPPDAPASAAVLPAISRPVRLNPSDIPF